jgi:hypothetical protein
MFYRLFTLNSVRESALVIVLSDSPFEIIKKFEPCPMLLHA